MKRIIHYLDLNVGSGVCGNAPLPYYGVNSLTTTLADVTCMLCLRKINKAAYRRKNADLQRRTK